MILRPVFLRLTALLIVAASSLQAQSPYQEIDVRDGARIIGTIRCESADLKSILAMDRTKDTDFCGTTKTSSRLMVGRNKGVRYAVVFLEGIVRGKKETGTMRPVLDQKGCDYDPHVMIAPLGSQLEIVNSDPILHNVHAYAVTEARTLFNIAQPIKGQRTSIKQMQMNKPGLVSAVCDAGHPWMSAFVVVVEHPYYALTDANGNFTLEDVPAGTYQIKMWHEGVQVTSVEYEHEKPKKYYFEEPYVMVKEVTVTSGETKKVDFLLELRKGNSGK